MNVACILTGGTNFVIDDTKGRRWRFEDHHYCGPVAVTTKGDPLENQPPEKSPFWECVSLWYKQGKMAHKLEHGDYLCIYHKEPEIKLKHIGGRNYVIDTN